MKRKSKPSAWRSRVVFVSTWFAGWILLLISLGHMATLLGFSRPWPTIIDHLLWLILQLTHALIQLLLMRRYMGITPHRWFMWTLSGLIVGILCQTLWKNIAVQSNLFAEPAALAIYVRLRFCFLFGIPTVFQYFSLPMHMSRRSLWLLAAVPGALLPTQQPMIGVAVIITVFLQALAINLIAARNVSIKPIGDRDTGQEVVKDKR